jgi:hypothetical protein
VFVVVVDGEAPMGVFGSGCCAGEVRVVRPLGTRFAVAARLELLVLLWLALLVTFFPDDATEVGADDTDTGRAELIV